MVVAFVGSVGAWTQQVFGPDRLASAGIARANVATVFTLLPSFLFILIGGPAVEATRHDVKFTAPLTAITPVVVGVILNLAPLFRLACPVAAGDHGGPLQRAPRVVIPVPRRDRPPGTVAAQGRHHSGYRDLCRLRNGRVPRQVTGAARTDAVRSGLPLYFYGGRSRLNGYAPADQRISCSLVFEDEEPESCL